MVIGGHCWWVVVWYLALNDASTLERIVAGIIQQPQGVETLVTRNLNTDILAPDRDERNEKILADM